MAEQDMEMELTPERVKMIQDALLRQYCDQYGLEIVSVSRKENVSKPIEKAGGPESVK